MINFTILAQIGVGWLFIRWLIASDRGPKEPPRILLLAGVFGALAVVGSLFLEEWLLPKAFSSLPITVSLPTLIKGTLLIGLIEEGLKSVPLGIFLYRKGYFNEVTDGLIYFGISGMIFGILEDIGYALSFGPITGIAKLITGPYIHAGFAILIGWTLARRKVQRVSWVWVVGGLATAIGLHALYDFGLFYRQTWSVLLSLAITLGINLNILFLLRHAQRADTKLGIAAEGQNWYCRHCGQPNPERFLYCTSCGYKT